MAANLEEKSQFRCSHQKKSPGHAGAFCFEGGQLLGNLTASPPAISKDIADPEDTSPTAYGRTRSIKGAWDVLNSRAEQAIAVTAASTIGVAMPTEPAPVSGRDYQTAPCVVARKRHSLSGSHRYAECSDYGRHNNSYLHRPVHWQK